MNPTPRKGRPRKTPVETLMTNPHMRAWLVVSEIRPHGTMVYPLSDTDLVAIGTGRMLQVIDAVFGIKEETK